MLPLIGLMLFLMKSIYMKKQILGVFMALSILTACKKEKPDEIPGNRETAKVAFEIISESNFNYSLLGQHPGPNTLVYSSVDGKTMEPTFSLLTSIDRWSTVITAKDIKKGDRVRMFGSIMIESSGKKVISRIYVDDKVVTESSNTASSSPYGGEAKIDVSYTF